MLEILEMPDAGEVEGGGGRRGWGWGWGEGGKWGVCMIAASGSIQSRWEENVFEKERTLPVRMGPDPIHPSSACQHPVLMLLLPLLLLLMLMFLFSLPFPSINR